MKYKITLIIFFFAFTIVGYGQTTLAAGEIAITGFNADNPDQFTFVLLTDITATTEIKFTDNGQQTINYNVTDEGIITWIADTNYACGTEIIIEDTGSSTYSANFGAATETGPGFALAISGDQILAYQGPDITPTFIYAITFDSTGWFDADTPQTTTLPAGLTDGQDAVSLGEIDNATYNCAVTTDSALILQAVSTNTNWSLSNTILSIGGCGYTCVACISSTTWTAGGWNNGVPDLTTAVTISADYNTTASGANEPSFSACSLIIDAGSRLTIDNNKYVEVENRVTVNGQLFVQTQGAFVQNSDTEIFTVNATTGTALVNKSTTILNDWLEYTYWSSPVADDTVENALSIAPANRRFLFNATNFIDFLAEIGNTGVFNPGFDDIDDDGNDWQIASGIMIPGIGYAATVNEFGPFPGDRQFTFTGAFNNGVIQSAIVNNSGGLYNDWNFIGNPYPGAIDTSVFFSVNSSIVDDLIYLWSQATPVNANASGNEGSNFSNADYAMISGSGVNIAGGDGLIPDNYVPSGQGFFVEALAAGNVTFNNSMRVTGNNTQFFRASNINNTNAIWVNLNSDNGVFNQLAVAYIDGATNANDGSYFDAKRNLSGGNAAIIYSTIDGDDGKFAIQGKNVNSLDIDEVVSLGFKTNIEVATLYKFSIAQFEGDFFSNNTVYLKDNMLNVLHDLSLNDYTFTSEVGEFNDRFEIVFNENALSLGEHAINSDSLSIIELNNGNVQFKLSSPLELKSIEIIDLLGRTLYRLEANGNSKTYNLSNLSQATYIAKVELSNGVVITKKAVKRY
jgi:hypothetical protein